MTIVSRLKNIFFIKKNLKIIFRNYNKNLENGITNNICTKVNSRFYIENQFSEYYFENGFRKVYPYPYTYHTWCKKDWFGKKLYDVYSKFFPVHAQDKLNQLFQNGKIFVNGISVEKNYILKPNDFIVHTVHRHEVPVIAIPIKIVYEDNDFLVVDKPPSIPIHASSSFVMNTLLFILNKELNYNNICVCHRLDRLTSGLIIFAKNKTKANECIELVRKREVHKEYICKVLGVFPDHLIEVNRPILQLSKAYGISIIHKNGKNSLTLFRKISDNGNTSLIKCFPKTGRTHQIRVHLQSLGYPVLNDPLYNSLIFGPKNGKDGLYHTDDIVELKKDVESKALNSWDSICTEKAREIHNPIVQKEIDEWKESINNNTSEQWKSYLISKKFDPTKVTRIQGCLSCEKKFREPTHAELFIFLHSLRYKISGLDVQTELPLWAN